MWTLYSNIALDYPKISLSEERQLIEQAQNGSKESKDELVLRHVGFLIFRIRRIVFPHILHRIGEDLLTEAILILYHKIESYNLDYRNRAGEPSPVKFASYIWKRVDGFIIDAIKREITEAKNIMSTPDCIDNINYRINNNLQ